MKQRNRDRVRCMATAPGPFICRAALRSGCLSACRFECQAFWPPEFARRAGPCRGPSRASVMRDSGECVRGLLAPGPDAACSRRPRHMPPPGLYGVTAQAVLCAGAHRRKSARQGFGEWAGAKSLRYGMQGAPTTGAQGRRAGIAGHGRSGVSGAAKPQIAHPMHRPG